MGPNFLITGCIVESERRYLKLHFVSSGAAQQKLNNFVTRPTDEPSHVQWH